MAIIAHALALVKNSYFQGDVNADRAAVLGMLHDCNEIITGDMPTPIKYYNPQIKTVYKDIEAISKNKLLSMLPKELSASYMGLLMEEEKDKELWILVKAADKIAAYIKCVEEDKAGNSEFKKAAEAVYNAIYGFKLPEVEYFMDNFMPSFFLTLDELD